MASDAAASDASPSRATKITSIACTIICSRFAAASGQASAIVAPNSARNVGAGAPVRGAAWLDMAGPDRGSDPAAPPQLPPLTEIQGEGRSEEHTSELQSLMRISYAVFCLTKKNSKNI